MALKISAAVGALALTVLAMPALADSSTVRGDKFRAERPASGVSVPHRAKVATAHHRWTYSPTWSMAYRVPLIGGVGF